MLNGRVNQVLVSTSADGSLSTVPVALYVKMRLHSDWLLTGILKDPFSSLVNVNSLLFVCLFGATAPSGPWLPHSRGF